MIRHRPYYSVHQVSIGCLFAPAYRSDSVETCLAKSMIVALNKIKMSPGYTAGWFLLQKMKLKDGRTDKRPIYINPLYITTRGPIVVFRKSLVSGFRCLVSEKDDGMRIPIILTTLVSLP